MSTSAHGTSRARRTLRILQSRIASGEWPLNSKIPTERELVEELGVGRSTVREAVRTLANMGMLEPAPSRGTFVRSLSPVSGVMAGFMGGRSASELIEVRIAIEVEAARLAARRRDDQDIAALRAAYAADRGTVGDRTAGREGAERGTNPGQFHALVLRAADSPLLAEMYAGVMAGLRGAVARGEVRQGVDAGVRRHDHRELLDAVVQGDVEEAGAAARRHVERDLVIADDPPSAD